MKQTLYDLALSTIIITNMSGAEQVNKAEASRSLDYQLFFNKHKRCYCFFLYEALLISMLCFKKI